MKSFKLVLGIIVCTTLVSSLPITSVQAASVSNIAVETNEEKNTTSTTTPVEEVEEITKPLEESYITGKEIGLSVLETPIIEKNSTLKNNVTTKKTTEDSSLQTEQQEEKIDLQAEGRTYNDWFPDDNLAKAVAFSLDDVSTDLVDETTLGQLDRLLCQNAGIKDMTGLKWLTGMVALECYGNQLTTIDVSNNPQLEYLDCKDNQLTSIDVSQNPNLREFYLSNNLVTSIDVSQNPKLFDFNLSNNLVTSIDVSQNPKLTQLKCSDNSLTSIDVSQNLILGTLECSNNQLTSVDISKNPQLTVLKVNNNQLVELDVSQNLEFRILECSNNQLTSLDLRGRHIFLHNVKCANNQLKDISTIPYGGDNNYDAVNQSITESRQVAVNGTLEYEIPTDLLDADGYKVTNITPQNGGVYKRYAVRPTITWKDLTGNGEVSFAFTSNDGKFSGTITVPYEVRKVFTISSDDEINYKEGVPQSEVDFLADIHASVAPTNETITSDFEDVVDFTTPGNYTVTLHVEGSNASKQVLVHVTEKVIDIPGIPPILDDPTKDMLAPPSDNLIDKTDGKSNEPILSVQNQMEISEKETPINADKDTTNSKELPRTGDTPFTGWVVAGIIFLGFGLLFLKKRKSPKN